MSAPCFLSVWCFIFLLVLGSTRHPQFSLTLAVLLLGLDRFQKTPLAVPEEGEAMDPTRRLKGDFEWSLHCQHHVTSLRYILKCTSVQPGRNDVVRNESYVHHFRSTFPNIYHRSSWVQCKVHTSSAKIWPK